MEADPGVYHLPALGREGITELPGMLATTCENVPKHHLMWEIPSASSLVQLCLWGKAPCRGGGFQQHQEVVPTVSLS